MVNEIREPKKPLSLKYEKKLKSLFGNEFSNSNFSTLPFHKKYLFLLSIIKDEIDQRKNITTTYLELMDVDENCEIVKSSEQNSCKMAVFGRLEDILHYMRCPDMYYTLNASKWTPELNMLYLTCALSGNLPNQSQCGVNLFFASSMEDIFSEEVISGKKIEEFIYPEGLNFPGGATKLEICLLKNSGKNVLLPQKSAKNMVVGLVTE